MKKLAILFFALAASAQTITLPDGNTIETLPNGETWAILHIKGEPLGVQLTPNMPATGEFQTFLIRNLPESNIVGAPQSVKIHILGNCQSKTIQIMGMLPYSEKMGGGLPDPEHAIDSEGVVRKVDPASPLAHVLKVACKP